MDSNDTKHPDERAAARCEMKPDSPLIPPGQEMRESQKTLLLSCIACWSSFGLNLAGAFASNSLTLWANTLRVGLEAAATSFGYSVTRRLAKKKTHRFDYGLGKWEDLSALFNASVMLVTLVIIVFHAASRFIQPKPVTGAGLGVAVLLFFSVVNLWLLARFWRLRGPNSSPVVESQFVLYRNASAASLVSLSAVAVSWFGGNYRWAVWFDPVGALLLCGIIFFGMITLFQRSLSVLLDQTLDESLQFRILRGLAACYDDYHQLRKLRARRSGRRIFVELFLEFQPELTVREMLIRSARLKGLVEGLIPNAEVWVIPCGPAEDQEPVEQ